MKKYIKYIPLALVIPAVVGAQVTTINSGLITIYNTLSLLMPILIAVAVVVLLWAIVRLMGEYDNERKRKDFKTLIIWSIIILFVMISIWGILALLAESFGLANATPSTPNLLTP